MPNSATQAATKSAASRFPFPIPFGWYRVIDSADLDVATVRGVHYFNRELVVWRDPAGIPVVMDGYCPHLGASLARGSVRAEGLQCSLHGWTFDADGACVRVPYADSPPRALVRRYPVVERNGYVFAWYHADDKPPSFDVPVVSELNQLDYSAILHRENVTVATAWQEIAENAADPWHFGPLHGNTIHSYEARYYGAERHASFIDSFSNAFGAFETKVTLHEIGPGFAIVRQASSPFESVLMSSLTPVDQEHVDIQHAWFMRSLESPERTQKACRLVARKSMRAFRQDVSNWESKQYLDRPLLLPVEQEVRRFRQWATQFYS